MIAPLNDTLRAAADQLERAAHADPHVRAVAAQLRGIADRGTVVALPVIDPARDDLTHWYGIGRSRLACEVTADAWNLAAGVHVAEHGAGVRVRL